MRKKLISWILALVLVISCVPTALAADLPEKPVGAERYNQPQSDNGISRDTIIRGYEKWRAWWKSWHSETVTYQTDGDWKYYVEGGNAIITAYLGNSTDVITPTTVGGYNVTVIGSGTFGYMTDLNSVTISQGVIQLGDFEFEDGEGGTFIEGEVFEGCESLTAVNLPITLETIGRSCFSWCMDLETITVTAGNENFSTVEGVLFSDTVDGKTMLCYPAAKTATTYTIPAGVRVAEGAMQSNGYLAELTIPSTVQIDWRGIEYLPGLKKVTVENGATSINGFGGCWQLESVTLPNSIKTIGEEAFSYCSKLTSITLPDQLESIGWNAFSGSGLTSLQIPASVNDIQPNAFTSCQYLTSIAFAGVDYYQVVNNILFTKGQDKLLVYPAGKSDLSYIVPEGVKEIVDSAFSGAKLTSITLPISLEGITGWNFSGCSDLQSITVPSENTLFKDIDGVLFTKQDVNGFMELIAYPLGKSQSSYTVPDKVTKIKDSAFSSSNLSQIILPDSLVEIENCAFMDSSLASITIPKNVTTIGESAFAYGDLETVTFAEPASVNEICSGAFMGTPLSSVRIPASVITIGDDAFSWCEQLASVDVDAANTHYKSEDGVLFSGDGKTLILFPPAKGLSGSKASGAQTSHATTATSYTLPNFVEEISSNAFASSRLTSITISENVKTIEPNAFVNNYNLSKVIVYSNSVAYKEAAINGLSDALGDDVFNGSPNVVLCGRTGSTTQAYAQRYGLPFKTIPSTVSLNTASATLFIGTSDKLSATTSPAGAELAWNSSNPSVVSVDSGGNIKANAVGTATITATSFDKSASCTVNVINPTPVGLSCTKTDATIYGAANGSVTITATGGNSGSYEYSLDGGASWQASNVFGGLAANTYTAVVRDAAFPSNTATQIVAVGQPNYIGTVPAAKIPSKVNAGNAVTVLPPAVPKGYTAQSTTFSSSNPAIATVDANGNVTFIAGGKVTIITKVVSQMVDKKGKVKTKTTTVKKTITVQQPVSSISLNLGSTTIARTQKVKLAASVAPGTASNKKVTWKSSHPKVASVSSSGVVTGKAGGTAVITCTAKDGSRVVASCTVTVTPIYPTGIKMSKAALTVKLGKTASLKATIAPKNTDFKTVTWASSNPAVVTVDAKGKIKGISAGTAVITAATSSGQMSSCTVTVQ